MCVGGGKKKNSNRHFLFRAENVLEAQIKKEPIIHCVGEFKWLNITFTASDLSQRRSNPFDSFGRSGFGEVSSFFVLVLTSERI